MSRGAGRAARSRASAAPRSSRINSFRTDNSEVSQFAARNAPDVDQAFVRTVRSERAARPPSASASRPKPKEESAGTVGGAVVVAEELLFAGVGSVTADVTVAVLTMLVEAGVPATT